MKKLFSFLALTAYSFLLTTSTRAADLGPPAAGKEQLVKLFTRIINLSVEAAFLVLFIMLIVAGIKYLTSGGDPKAIGSASGTLTWALLGILFLAIAWLLLLLIKSLTGVDVTKFCLGFEECV